MTTRSLYMVLSSRSLPYARLAIESLYKRSRERVHLHLITDSPEDGNALTRHMQFEQTPSSHTWSVHTGSELEDRAAQMFGRHEYLREFRRGHPCWRKITDPLLLADAGAEMIVLDPDLYFPNTFTFEGTPASELLLMWQRPNCLFPPAVVRTAMAAQVPLANHVDIGVAQWRGPGDMEWLNWFIGRLGGSTLPRVMHIEAIVWAALAMQLGGGYLDATLWHCWHRTQAKRVMRLVKVPGPTILRLERWEKMKCFHGGGEAKWWIPRASENGIMQSHTEHSGPGPILPFRELTPRRYGREQSFKRLLRGIGYYSLFRTA